MYWQLEGATTPQDIIQLATENPLPPSGDKFWRKIAYNLWRVQIPVEKTVQSKFELFWHSICLRDEDGIIELYQNISSLEKIKAVGENFNEHSGMDSLYVNISILREAIETITDDRDLRKSIFKIILHVWRDIGIWINEQ